MKKNALFVLTLMTMVLTLIFMFGCIEYGTDEDDYLRIHIRANSNLPCDQEVKLAVRDSLVQYLSPLLSEARTREEAEKIIISHIPEIETVTNELLYSCGYYYGCEAEVNTEYFEKKRYGNLELEAGYYRAVILNLGTGEGQNWWCVAFPPLCFTSDDYDNINYKSILYEIIKKYSKKEGK